MADHTIKPATPDAPSAHVPGAGPERNLHQDHDTARAQAGTAGGQAPGQGTGQASSQGTGQGTGQASSQASSQASDFAAKVGDTAGQTAEQIRQAADAAAERLRRTASDAVSQAHQRASQAYGSFQQGGSETLDRARDYANDAIESGARRYADLRERSSAQISRGQSAVERFVGENPLLVGVVGLAAGLMIGALLPRTRREDETVGAWADEVRDQGLRYAREATERGRQFVESALDQAQDAASAAAHAATDELRQADQGGATPRPGGPTIQTH
ncbi:conserved hypothetical protein [Methylobacterium sp. 4-46]|uniref:hypothetical protein n=1 Tax=unclassified Methylobacterium TaxID=2615210 RepID=UPI000152E133|nr:MULTISPECIES: hypothetical protein [Methylobacterium]ACA21063.1 conserved hypothetical protein [Methylobacterium sp. 4-46]WFT80212.1 hypothetical protein QA634_34430 [Methylobacterium nodulans]